VILVTKIHEHDDVFTSRLTIQAGGNQLFISRGAIFMKFHSTTSSCLFKRGTTFSQTVTGNVLFAAFTKMTTFQFLIKMQTE